MMSIDAKAKEEAGLVWEALRPDAKEVLGQLFLNGPQYDGCVVSKMGRDGLFCHDLISRGFGWQWLTQRGVLVATLAPVGDLFEGCWRKKQCM